MLLSVLDKINSGIGSMFVAPSGVYWFDSCENLNHFIVYNTTSQWTKQVNMTDFMEGKGSMAINWFGAGYTGTVSMVLTNMSMVPSPLPLINPLYSDSDYLWYGAYAKIDIDHNANISYGVPSYYVQWEDLSGGNRLWFGENTVYHNWTCSISATGYGTQTFISDIPVDTNWHWFEIMVENLNAIETGHSSYMFLIDGNSLSDSFPLDVPFAPFYPQIFLTSNNPTYDHWGMWKIDYLRTANTQEDIPTLPLSVPHQDLFGADIILMAIGLIGAMMLILAPVYCIETFIEGDYVSAFGYAFLMVLLGFGFVVAWLFA